MVGSDIDDINSPTHVGSRSTRVDPKLFGKPSDFSGDRREWRHFEWVFRNWFGFLYDTAEEWLDQAANSPVELGEAVPDRRETDKALCMSLAMVCKNEALDVVKTVTHKRGFESWCKLSKEYGATTGTSLHQYTNLLGYDFGNTDGFKKRLLKWENQIVDFQKATGEGFSDRLNCAIALSRSPAPIRTYLRVQNRGDYGALRVAKKNFLEAEDDGHGPVPMEVGAMKGKKGDTGKKGYGKGKYGKSLGKYPFFLLFPILFSPPFFLSFFFLFFTSFFSPFVSYFFPPLFLLLSSFFPSFFPPFSSLVFPFVLFFSLSLFFFFSLFSFLFFLSFLSFLFLSFLWFLLFLLFLLSLLFLLFFCSSCSSSPLVLQSSLPFVLSSSRIPPCLLACLRVCFCLRLKHFQVYFRAWRTEAWLPDASGCLGQQSLGQQLLPAFKALSSFFSGLLACLYVPFRAPAAGTKTSTKQ